MATTVQTNQWAAPSLGSRAYPPPLLAGCRQPFGAINAIFMCASPTFISFRYPKLRSVDGQEGGVYVSVSRLCKAIAPPSAVHPRRMSQRLDALRQLLQLKNRLPVLGVAHIRRLVVFVFRPFLHQPNAGLASLLCTVELGTLMKTLCRKADRRFLKKTQDRSETQERHTCLSERYSILRIRQSPKTYSGVADWPISSTRVALVHKMEREAVTRCIHQVRRSHLLILAKAEQFNDRWR